MQIGQKRQSGPERTQREGSRTVKGWYKALEDLVWLTQLGLNMLLPVRLSVVSPSARAT